LVGRLDGSLDGAVAGRPVSLVAEDRDVTLCVAKFSTLLSLRRTWKANGRVLMELLERSDLRVLVRVGRLVTTEVFPNPNLVMSFLLPRG
jgi:hypothetical protein